MSNYGGYYFDAKSILIPVEAQMGIWLGGLLGEKK